MTELCDLPHTRPRGERVALVGLRGAGKSTVGRALALALEAPFVELDERIERLAGLSLAEIFDVQGVEAYRRYEAEALEQVLSEGDRLVFATGGSIVNSPETFARLCRTCRTVWVRAEPAEHFQRVLDQGDRRPMRNHPRAMAELQALLDAREPLYGQCELEASTTDREPEDVVEGLLRGLAE
jgi:XRE family aerobic/anaerobic benzoate catabolism transcriptional regulator